MSGAGSDTKKQLGKILLQQKRVPADSKREPTMRPAVPAVRKEQLLRKEQLRALGEQHGLPAVDLTEQVVPIATLRLLPVEIARERKIFAFGLDAEKLNVALCAPLGADALAELEFVTGKKIQSFVAPEEVVRAVTDAAYVRLAQGEEQYVGENAPSAATAAVPGVVVPSPAALRPARIPSEGRLVATALDEAFARRIPLSQQPAPSKLAQTTRVLVGMRPGEVRSQIKRGLEEAGVSVVESDDGTRALEALRGERPELLVLEPELPGIDGFDVCRRLRASSRYEMLPIVVVLADSAGSWRLAQDLRDVYGIEHIVEPPVEASRVAQMVRLALLGLPPIVECLPLSESAEGHWTAGMEAFHKGDLAAAITELEVAAQLDPEAFDLRYHLGLLYGRRDDVFAAIRALELALRMQPRHFLACKNLAAVLERAGFRHRALDAWERALSLAPDEETRVMIREYVGELLAPAEAAKR